MLTVGWKQETNSGVQWQSRRWPNRSPDLLCLWIFLLYNHVTWLPRLLPTIKMTMASRGLGRQSIVFLVYMESGGHLSSGKSHPLAFIRLSMFPRIQVLCLFPSPCFPQNIFWWQFICTWRCSCIFVYYFKVKDMQFKLQNINLE